MEISSALDLVKRRHESVLVTMRKDGRPQLSNVGHLVSDDGLIRVLIQSDGAKYTNLVRQPWAAIHIARADFSGYVVIEGSVELSSIAKKKDDDTVDELVAVYRAMVGEQPDWEAFRKRMVQEKRVVIRIHPTRSYGYLP